VIMASNRQLQVQHMYSYTNLFAVEGAGGIFQIRPHKDFTPAKGRERVLSLPLLLDLPSRESFGSRDSSDASQIKEPRNAYDFMRIRRDVGSDPTLKRWNASIRLSNFASADSSPLCVCRPLLHIY
jgi:DNA mismatch repair protein MSH5